MNAKKTASARISKSDMARVDAHAIQAEEYDDLPDLTEDMLSRAVLKKNGRPVSLSPKVLLSVRYSPEVVEFFRSTGAGWQSRMNGVLLNYVKRHGKTAASR